MCSSSNFMYGSAKIRGPLTSNYRAENLWIKNANNLCNLFTHGAPRSSQELIQKCPCIPGSNWNLEMLVFEERGKPESPEKNLSEQSIEPTTSSIYMWRLHVGREPNPSDTGGRRALSPLCPPCSPSLLLSCFVVAVLNFNVHVHVCFHLVQDEMFAGSCPEL